jgi:hypothetical protein
LQNLEHDNPRPYLIAFGRRPWNRSDHTELQPSKGKLKECERMNPERMNAMEVQSYARQLNEALGSEAIAAAAQRALMYERRKDVEQAQAWRRIQAALALMGGPRAT